MRLAYLRGRVRLVGPYQWVVRSLSWKPKIIATGRPLEPPLGTGSDVEDMPEFRELVPSTSVDEVMASACVVPTVGEIVGTSAVMMSVVSTTAGS